MIDIRSEFFDFQMITQEWESGTQANLPRQLRYHPSAIYVEGTFSSGVLHFHFLSPAWYMKFIVFKSSRLRRSALRSYITHERMRILSFAKQKAEDAPDAPHAGGIHTFGPLVQCFMWREKAALWNYHGIIMESKDISLQ